MIRRRFIVRKMYFLFIVAVVLSLLIIYNISELAQNLIKDYDLRKSQQLNVKSKIPQVVGHYVGNGNLFQISNKEFLNTNEFEPIPGAGEYGKPVIIPPKDILKMQHYFQLNRYNLLASDRMSLNRTVPDVRRHNCTIKKYPDHLPNTSIIIVFHNEAWSVLLRTVWSVINRSPRKLLKEIFLVDDASTRTFLKNDLDEYVKLFPVPTKVLRLQKRDGLIAARMLGAHAATGDTLTFLDAHCECSPGWLEPLLARVLENRRKIVCPVIDIISDDNFSYIKSFEFHWGAFNWELHFRWYSLGEYELVKRKKDITEPFHSPTMAGGLFTVDRDYFFEVGAYDEAMKIWGGDNLEMSFRVWQCGGEIEIAPCSHVGHLFRKSSPYTFPGGVGEILNRNLARLASVWMDDWGKFFFYFNEEANNLHKQSDVSDRIKLRQQLKCNSFEWYLDNVWPQHFFPTDDRFFGRIQLYKQDIKYIDTYKELLKENNLFYLKDRQKKYQKLLEKEINSFCIQRPRSNNSMHQPFGKVSLKKCTAGLKKMDEMFIITSDGQILTNEGICFNHMDTETEDGGKEEKIFARMTTCNYKNRQKWHYDIQTLQIKHKFSDKCLGADQEDQLAQKSKEMTISTEVAIVIKKCDEADNSQKWILFPVQWH